MSYGIGSPANPSDECVFRTRPPLDCSLGVGVDGVGVGGVKCDGGNGCGHRCEHKVLTRNDARRSVNRQPHATWAVGVVVYAACTLVSWCVSMSVSVMPLVHVGCVGAGGGIVAETHVT